jgi:hypothetical protein
MLSLSDGYKAEIFEFGKRLWNDIDAETMGGEVDEHDVSTKGFKLSQEFVLVFGFAYNTDARLGV